MIYVLGFIAFAVLSWLVAKTFFPQQLVTLIVSLWRQSARLKLAEIEVGDDTWPYLHGGPVKAPILVLVHGFGANKDSWIPYAQQLTRHYRIVAPDLPGFGDATRNPDYSYRIAPQAERLAAFLDRLGIETCHMAGNSMGGFIAAQLALSSPDRLMSLTLIDNAGVNGLKKSELEEAVDRGENPLVLTSMDQVDALLEFISHKKIWMPAIVKKVTFEAAIAEQPFLDALFWSLADDMDSGALNDRLSQIKVPTLIIWGRQDRLLDVSCTEVMEQHIPNSHVVVMEETGHVPNMERPKETAAIQLAFLKDVPDSVRATPSV